MSEGPARTFLAAPSPLSLLLFKFVVVSMFLRGGGAVVAFLGFSSKLLLGLSLANVGKLFDRR